MHQLTRFPAAGGTIPFPMLVGWLDDHRAVVVIGSPNPDGPGTLDGPAMRAEVWDTTSQQRTSTSAWVPLAGKGMMGSPQAWLAGSGDSARVVLKTGSLWRLDPVGGQVERVVEDLPAIKNLGSFVTASPDRWHALYGGGMNQARHGVVDLRTGHDLPLPETWRRVVWGGTGHLLALTNTEAYPGQVLTGYDGAWDFYGVVVVASVDGKVQRQRPLPTGLLAANAHETAEGWVIVESVRLIKDPTEKEFGYRVENGPLMSASPTDTALYPLWDWTGKYAPGSPIPWLLAGNWLLVDQKQLPLAGGQSIPLPDGLRSLIPQPEEPTQPPGNPLVVGSGSQLSLFLAGQTQALPMGSAYEEKVLQLDRTGNWAAVRFYGVNAMAELHLVQVAP